MGVAGSGKTTVASLFAQQTGAIFYEGDDFHPKENVEKMRAGIPLTDADREQWLQALREVITRAIAQNQFVVMTCSALKAKYRAVLKGADACVHFVFLEGSPALIEPRLSRRHGHYMPASLLASQFEILEPPTDAMTFRVDQPPEKIVAALVHALATGRFD
jgi:carbohydrate kinase (thermoresistant glucokinase family)